jgi:hypothetical protein
VDTEDAWPEKGHLSLDGFTFGHFGGYTGTAAKMRDRGAKWWDEKWAQLDVYSPSPYQNLAAAFIAAGDRDQADEIRYRGRARERDEKLTGWSWVGAGLLGSVAGFGIGGYTFRVLYWVVGISLLGALYLRCAKGVRESGHGFVWCFGASLTRLLPIIEINKEFTDFFNDPKRERLTGFQTFFFSVVGVVGWFLAAILIAAVFGLTGKS